jgi:hypothetical protein
MTKWDLSLECKDGSIIEKPSHVLHHNNNVRKSCHASTNAEKALAKSFHDESTQ